MPDPRATGFADEPTAELDAATRDPVLHVLLAETHSGAVVVLATHDRYVADVADTDVVLEDGRVVEP